jgi:Spy/CpxP family protein refolding chaperone
MKKILFILLGVIIGYAASAYVLKSCRGKEMLASSMAASLHLTEDQKVKIQAIEKTYLENKQQALSDLDKRKEKLRELLSKPDVLDDQIHAQVDLIVASQDRLVRSKIDYYFSVRNLLNAEQKKDFSNFSKLSVENTSSACPFTKFLKKSSK